MLTLAEEYLLLSLDDEKGSFNTWVDLGTAGAVLAELVEEGLVALEGDKVHALQASADGDPVLDIMLGQIYASEKTRTALHWVQRVGMRSETRRAVAERLVSAGILQREDRKFLRLIPYSRFPEVDPGPEHEVVARLRSVVLEGQSPDARSATLLAILEVSSALGVVLTRAERKAAKARLKELTREDAIGEAAAATVKAIQLAIAAAVAAST